MLDLNAPILPGQSAAGIQVGQSIAEVLHQVPALTIETSPTLTLYKFGAVWVWSQDEIVDQIAVFEGYTGTLPSGVGLGMSLAEVQLRMGLVVEDWDDTLRVEGSDGWCFDTSSWDNGWEVEQNLEAKLVEIAVFNSKQATQ